VLNAADRATFITVGSPSFTRIRFKSGNNPGPSALRQCDSSCAPGKNQLAPESIPHGKIPINKPE